MNITNVFCELKLLNRLSLLVLCYFRDNSSHSNECSTFENIVAFALVVRGDGVSSVLHYLQYSY